MRRAALISSLAGILLLAAPAALAQDAGVLTVSGSVDGEVLKGERIVVHVDLNHKGGYRKIDEIRVALVANDIEVESVLIEPPVNSVNIPGAGTKSFLDTQPVEGAFFSVIGDEVRLDARGKRLRMTIPIRMLSDPPEGSRLEVSAKAGLATAGPDALTQPAEHKTARSLAGILLAATVAVFAGAAIGVSVGARRRPGPSVYDSVRRRLDEPAAASDSAKDKSAPARKATAKKATAKKATAKKATAKKSPAKKSPARRSSAAGRRPSGPRRGGRTT
ncbi:MAG: hypothetical protein LC722_00755 [Actinobacteria bacterium]|nr:hypothetical protein [Actinomycetota bacterium]